MLTKITPKISLIDFIKLVGAVIIIYLGLSVNVGNVGESISDFFQKDYLSTDEHGAYSLEELISILSESENVSGLNYSDFCKKNTKICQKLSFKSEYKEDQKIYYLSGSVYVVGGMNSYMVLGNNLLKSFGIMNIQKENSSKRAWTRGDNVFVNTKNIYASNEFLELLGHEFGHIVDLYSIKGFSNKKDKNFTEFNKVIFSIDDPSIEFYKISWESEKIRKSKAKPDDFCSGYGMYDIFEDFAECNNMYLNHNSVFKFIAKNNSILKNKYNFIANLYNGKYLSNDAKSLANIRSKSIARRPRDTTKMLNN